MQLTIAIAQLKPRKGDFAANLARLGTVFAQLGELPRRPDVLLLPETALTGYFLEGGVRELARTAGELFEDLQRAYLVACGPDAPPLDVAVGFYERFRDRLYNSALYASLGGGAPAIRHVHRKVFLPSYGVFDEQRFVEAGRQIAAFDTAWGRAALLICEDAWHSLSGTAAALDGAQVVFVVSASPARGAQGARPDNVEHWEDLMRRIADEHGVFTALAQLVGFEGGKGFPGASLVMGPRGDVRVTGPLWDEALITATVDLADLGLARADVPLLSDMETMLPHLQEELARTQRGESAVVRWDSARTGASATGEARSESLTSLAAPAPPRPAAPALPVVSARAFDREEPVTLLNAEMARRWLVEFLRDEVTRRRGFQQVVVGLSGGVDSALTTYLCAEAFGPQNVLAVRMPYRTSSRESLEHAQLCIDDLGIRSLTVDISDAVDGYARMDPEIDARRKGNIMARTRMIVLFDQSQKLGTIPIGTGNKTERLFGYYTWHADDSPPVNPLGDLYKTQVWQLARHVGVPDVIIDKPASADLVVGQTDEADFGISYARADHILHFLLQGYSVERLVALGFGQEEVLLVKRRVDGTHWKRRLPSTAMLSPTAIGEYYLRPVDY
jgi:NAD+ synthase (glutamine-hydrolysing)